MLSTLALFAPLVGILALANRAERQRTDGVGRSNYAVAAYSALTVLFVLMATAGVIVEVASGMAAGQTQSWADLLAGFGYSSSLLAGSIDSFPLIGVGLWVPSLVGLILLLPRVRVALARVLPLDPNSVVHGVALSYTMLVVSYLLITVGVGLGNLSDLIAANPAANDAEMTYAAIWLQQVAMVVLAAVGVGWGTRRTLRETLGRLGLQRPTGSQIGAGIGFGLAGVVGIVILGGTATLLGVGADPDVARLADQLTGVLFRSVFGILTLGVAAALGEETLLRGALQPRFSLPVTALLFALLHSNYGISFSTLVMFLMGLFLGWVRIHYNTSVSMVSHATYNMCLGMLASLALSLGS